jgi:hypothetical protein
VEARHYYHLSALYLGGPKITLTPRDFGVNRGYDEPDNKRICVAPSPEHCMIALGGLLCSGDYIYVYKTKNKVKGFSPHNVVDVDVTLERWLLRRTSFVLETQIELECANGLIDILEDMNHIGTAKGIPIQRLALQKLKRMKLTFASVVV